MEQESVYWEIKWPNHFYTVHICMQNIAQESKEKSG